MLKNWPLVFEAFLRQAEADDVEAFLEAWPRLVHRNPKTFVFDTRGAAAEAEQTAAAAQHVEQRDLLGDADRVVPGDHDDRGAEVDALRSAREIRQQAATATATWHSR